MKRLRGGVTFLLLPCDEKPPEGDFCLGKKLKEIIQNPIFRPTWETLLIYRFFYLPKLLIFDTF